VTSECGIDRPLVERCAPTAIDAMESRLSLN
jgi:hypothetical protein